MIRLVIANKTSWIDASNQLSLGSTDWGDVVCVWGWAGFVSEAISAETAFPSPSSGQPISFVPNNIHLLHLPHRRPFPLSKSGWNFWLGKRWLLLGLRQKWMIQSCCPWKVVTLFLNFIYFLAQVDCEERLFKHYAFRSQKIAAFTSYIPHCL